ncbi:carbon starvation CstA family protein [Nitrosomonas sp. Nm132]|uniref:carbon starvation CstA family protein n=1 Tax=Nitrosomonas sp. Nm132 TaxID=1881053 RepID=UPI00087E79F2|nr:carbon starvation CstA family protein [Nitrosomonas sp. Nm132]SDH86098.1 carbon starvation protein [Nitrosomonas sp. Nm132]
MNHLIKHAGWLILAIAGAFSFGVIALQQGESINAIWIVIAAVCVHLIGYRYYSLFISRRVLGLDSERMTPAHKFNDGLDYVPTNKYVLFGHHFAAIAGAGPLVGPILAAQMGYLPGLLWLLVGVVIAGAVQDFIVLFMSMRRDGRSLGDMIKSELGPVPGMIALVGTFFIMLILLAVLALIVVKALAESPWGTFTVAATIPIAFFMGIYARYIRPGQIGEISLIGFILLMLSIMGGQSVQENPELAALFTFDGIQLTWMLIAYGAFASVLPVWLLLAPRDYLSTFLKIGTIAGLAVGVLAISPELKMPAITQFVDGTGPVWSGSLFPFLFITIACGAVSGFHSLISSGTTPKMIKNEKDARFIGYGAMLMESFVAIMALVAASIIEPGIYFAMNSPAALIGATAESAAQAISQWGFYLTPEMLTQTAKDVGENTIISRTGGAPTLAVGMAQILSNFIGGQAMMAFWYHFAILFEALFILTAVDAGTRAGRFMLQDLLGTFIPAMKRTNSLSANLIATVLCVSGWGYFLYQGVIDPLGGINTLWPLFGITNQMLACIALILCTCILFKTQRDRYAWITIVPTVWIACTTLTAAWHKIFNDNPRIGFLAHANSYEAALSDGNLLAPAKSTSQMQQVIFNDYLDAGLAAMFMCILISMLFFGFRTVLLARRTAQIELSPLNPY